MASNRIRCDEAIEWGMQENVFKQGGSSIESAEPIRRCANYANNPFKGQARGTISLGEVKAYLTACHENRVDGRENYRHR